MRHFQRFETTLAPLRWQVLTTVFGGRSDTQFDHLTTIVGVVLTGLLLAALLAIDIGAVGGRRAGLALTLASIGLGLAVVWIGLLRSDRLAVD